MRVAILVDGAAREGGPDARDALVQVDTVRRALAGDTCETADFSLDLAAAAATLRRMAPDLVFNLVESVEGKGRLVHLAPALLDTLGLPYTGARTAAMFLSTDKLLTKRILQAADVPTPPWFARADLARRDSVPAGKYIVKSVHEDASLGLDDDSVVETARAAELTRAIDRLGPRLGGEAFAEAYVEGREFNLSLLDGEVLPIAEIHFVDFPASKPRIVGYAAKWHEDSAEYRNTPRAFGVEVENPRLAAALASLARLSWDACGLQGYGRVDFRVDERGTPFVLEVNANPCLSPDAGFLAAAAEAGLTPTDVVRRVVSSALPPG